MQKVGIVAYKMTKQDEKIEMSRERMIFNLIKTLYAESGIKKEDIDTVVMCSNDFYDGRTISNVFTVDVSSAYHKDETKVEQEGVYALIYAVMRVLSGFHKTALVIAHSMASQSNIYGTHKAALNPSYDRVVDWVNEFVIAAFQARAYMEKYGVSEEQIAQVSVKNLQAASKNPYANRAIPGLTVDKVLNSQPYYLPIRELNCYPLTDGIAAIILAEEKTAEKLTKKPVWIKGLGYSTDTYFIGERNLAELSSLYDAAKMAYKMAKINSPKEDIDLCEVSEYFSHQELMSYEALGLCKEGEGKKLMEKGITKISGKIPVNPSGGCLAANALCASGLVRIIEGCRQIQGKAGEHQVDNKIKNVVCHGQVGIAAQGNAVVILGA